MITIFPSPRRGRKSSVKYESITMGTTPQLTPESGMAKWNYIFQVRQSHFGSKKIGVYLSNFFFSFSLQYS